MWRDRLLWIDGSGGAVVGGLMLLTFGWLAPWYGLPTNVVLFIALANLAYGVYALSLARQPQRSYRMLMLLIAANACWPLVCLYLMLTSSDTLSALGYLHLIGEALYVGGLAMVEWRFREHLRVAPAR